MPEQRLACLLLVATLGSFGLRAEDAPPAGTPAGSPAKPQEKSPDTIIFKDGNRLTGKITKAGGGSVAFHSDDVGDLTISTSKIATIETDRTFAVGQKTLLFTRKNVATQMPVGNIEVNNSMVKVTLAGINLDSFPLDKLGFLIPADDFKKEIRNQHSLLHGWTGSASLGVSIVSATNRSETYTGAVTLARAIPVNATLPPVNKTTLNLSGTYGLAKDPEIITNGEVYQTASETKTDILHGDAEYDRYFTQYVYALVNASADHNFGNGLQLQESYGGGIGWSVLRSPSESLDLKASLQYELQSFYSNLSNGLGTPDDNLIGITFAESWSRTFPHSIKLTQGISATPMFNLEQAGTAGANAGLTFPVYKKLSFAVNSTDSYIGDPPDGYYRNSFQFMTGLTYTLK